MNTLPVLQKNAYLTVVVKDNYIYAELAYSDFAGNRTYILSDTTDLSPLKFRMDDNVFGYKFWKEYFNALESEFDWSLIDKRWPESFRFIDFEYEGSGINGMKVLIDDNQPFFNNIIMSLKEISKDITIRTIDDGYIRNLMEGLSQRLKYDDILWIDLDLSHFSVFRYRNELVKKNYFDKNPNIVQKFSSSKIDWNSEIGLVDSIKNSKLQAFLATDTSSEDLVNRWANFVANSVNTVPDILIEDVLRSFTTVQLLSLKLDNKEKLEGFGKNLNKSAMILSGKIAKLLPKKLIMLSVIDGLELEGEFDLFVDSENSLLAYGKNLIEAHNSKDIFVVKSDVLPLASKVLIPELRSSDGKNRVVYSAKILSQDFDNRDVYAINPNFEIFPIPYVNNKVIVEGEFKNGTVLLGEKNFDFVSSLAGVLYDSLIIDSRFRPVIYGPKNFDNKLKLQLWLNGNKE